MTAVPNPNGVFAATGRSIDEIAQLLALRFDGDFGLEAAEPAAWRNELIMCERGYAGDYDRLVEAVAGFFPALRPGPGRAWAGAAPEGRA